MDLLIIMSLALLKPPGWQKKLVARVNYELEDQFFLMMFVTGLKEEIRYIVQIMKPESLSVAIELALRQEKELQFQQESQEMVNSTPRILPQVSMSAAGVGLKASVV